MDLDKRHEELLKLLHELRGDDSVRDFQCKYVKEANGRVYFSLGGNLVSQDGSRAPFGNTSATDVVFSLYDARYIECAEPQAGDTPFERFENLPDLREARYAGPVSYTIPNLQITDDGYKLVDRSFANP
jgi:hypothetical protein